MSNTAVGQLYKRIIDAVVEVSRTDFEESGIDNRTLLDLQDRWQTKLSNLHRASFPWDPQPTTSDQPETSTVPSSNARANNTTTTTTQNSAPESYQAPVTQQQNASNVQIKTEPGYDTSFLNLPQTYGSGQNTSASQRAAQLMQERYGSQARASIASLQAQTAGAQNTSIGQQRPPSAPENQRPQQPQQPTSPPLKQESSNPGIPQTDGPGDAAQQWDAIVVQRNRRGDDEPLGRIDADGFIRRQVEEMKDRLEAGGLLIPLEERTRKRKTSRQAKPSPNRSVAGPSAFDGAESDDEKPPKEEEDDAINSELDDSEDDIDEGIEPSMEGDTILCLYDKVQRVKNKWKCTLKDGIVTVGGKDYVFHKASGEFEW